MINIKNLILSITSASFLIGLTACTDGYNGYNTNPYDTTKEEMQRDGYLLSSALTGMEGWVIPLDVNTSQFIECLLGGSFSGYISDSNSGFNGKNFACYNPEEHWIRVPFNDVIPAIFIRYAQVKQATDDPIPLAVSDIIKVTAMQRITDIYGPIPYSKYGGTMKVAYDSQEEVYKAFFSELDNAIDVLQKYHDADNSAQLLANYDYVYNGNVQRWLKFANTLRLRLAIRISYADESLAKAEATKSINSAAGFMTTKDDAAKHTLNSAKFTYNNPYWEVTTSWQDLHMGASIDSYMNGYADPRVSSYFVARGGGCFGVRLGLTDINQSSYLDVTSPANIGQNDPVYWMKAAEGYFLRAEAKLRWDLGSETAQSLYEQGITLSFDEAGVSGAASYLSNSTSVPADFADKSGNGNDTSARGTVTIAWNDNDNFETKLEKIITQKWIAIYPDGEEAWSEFRRTNYPKLFPTMNDLSGLSLQSLQIRRLRFPTSEYETNNANVTAAATLLGGTDNAKTQLWWDKKSH